MFHIAVRCNNNKDASNRFFELVDVLESRGITFNRLDYASLIVGNKKARARFYCKSDESWKNSKFDLAVGFKSSEQKEILKDGCRTRWKFNDMSVDFVPDLVEYFV